MAMTRKHFSELAEVIGLIAFKAELDQVQEKILIQELATFCVGQNDLFNREKFSTYARERIHAEKVGRGLLR